MHVLLGAPTGVDTDLPPVGPAGVDTDSPPAGLLHVLLMRRTLAVVIAVGASGTMHVLLYAPTGVDTDLPPVGPAGAHTGPPPAGLSHELFMASAVATLL